jgi:hypothetical protein
MDVATYLVHKNISHQIIGSLPITLEGPIKMKKAHQIVEQIALLSSIEVVDQKQLKQLPKQTISAFITQINEEMWRLVQLKLE